MIEIIVWQKRVRGMKKEWKRVLLQWVCPLIVLLVIIIVLFQQFSSSVHGGIEDAFQQKLIITTAKYEEELKREFAKIHTVGDMIAGLAFEDGADMRVVKEVLASGVEETDLYEAVICRPDGSALTSEGKVIDIKDASYYEWSTGVHDYAYRYVSDDGMTGEAALLMSISSENDEQHVILYYPVSKVESIIRMDEEFDGEAFAAILNEKGKIIVSTDTNTAFFSDTDFWSYMDTGYKTTASRVRRELLDGKSGCADFKSQDEERTIVYLPLDEWSLVVGINGTYVQSMEAVYGKKMTTSMHRAIFTVIIGMLAIVVSNFIASVTVLKGTRQLKEKADTDQLTGLGNKLSTEHRIKEYMADSPDSLAVMFVLDIDNFKKINDTMGHAFGDEVLRELGRHIGVNFRVTDIIGRTGGDEFTIFLKNLKDVGNAEKEAQKLEYFFQHFQVGDYVKYSATASIGAAIFPTDGEDFETLYKAADAALYKAKRRGKNQLAFFDEKEKA